MAINFTNTVQSVTEITRSIKGILEHGFAFVAVNGEVSNLRRPYSGHLYFTLKDDNAQLKAVLFKSQSRYLEKELRDGAQVICRGRVSVYEARGDYQIIVDSVDFAGAGLKHLAFEKLKRRLEAEGLFAADHKQPLPFLPHKIALITSPQGAAVHDFLKIAARRFPAVPIEIYPAPMQGEQAAAAIIQALSLIQRRDCEVIVICRGGGSLEDLWPFNNEELAREIYNCPLPVVSAIGHEVDFTILDLVADERAPTPTAAAEAVLPDGRVLSRAVSQNRNRLIEAMSRRLTALRQRTEAQCRLLAVPAHALRGIRLRLEQTENNLQRAMANKLLAASRAVDNRVNGLLLHSPKTLIKRHRERIKSLEDGLRRQIRASLEHETTRFRQAAALLNAVSPLNILGRGYAVVTRLPDNKILRSHSEASPGDRLRLTLHDGKIDCEVVA
ncbi:Exodeoxyribonuclease VII large subunit [hydrothermal vent metagenome]|uniref:Exodeoxyribonuclease VII large subunit n=1 Tax=hydrothermal vent metagenome TaxID=652676 RepID=A0A3B0V463_9ZZZZ